MWLLKLFLISVGLCYSNAKFDDSVIHTDSGAVEGWERVSRDGRIYQAWTGIPYAESPVGLLRFKPPVPKSSWQGVLNATGDASACLQTGMLGFSGIRGSEDCLYLNVYRPKIKKENMPVLVHIHGGAFQGGSMGPRENADYLMDEDVVLVGIQYRLGAFGFMSLGDSVMPGNFGLKDQVLALKWIRRNIAAFGGNPGSVTVFGESAGGASSHILLKSPAADDLVNRAVSDSGSINRFWALQKTDSSRSLALVFAEKCGCSDGSSQQVLNCLQKIDASAITDIMAQGITESVPSFMPVIEPVDTEEPVATFDLSIRPSNKPWITSICTGEWMLMRAMMGTKKLPTDLRQFVVDVLSTQPIKMTETQILGAAEILDKFYFSSNLSANEVYQASKLEADMSFSYPAMANIAKQKGPRWIYRYEYEDEISRYFKGLLSITEEGAFHATQVDSYLNVRSTYPMLSPVETPEDREVSKRMIKYLVNFAYYDDPTPGPSPFKWKQFKRTEVLRVTELGDYLADVKTLREINDVYDLWDTIYGNSKT